MGCALDISYCCWGQARQQRGPLQNQHTAQSKHILEHAKGRTGKPTGRPRDAKRVLIPCLSTPVFQAVSDTLRKGTARLTSSGAKMEKLFLQHQKFEVLIHPCMSSVSKLLLHSLQAGRMQRRRAGAFPCTIINDAIFASEPPVAQIPHPSQPQPGSLRSAIVSS